MVTKLRITSQVFSKNLRNPRTIIYQKNSLQLSYNNTETLMLKEGMKTINAEFIRTRASSQFSFGQFRSYATSFPGLLLTLTLTWKSKMIPGTSLDLTPSFKTSVDARVEGLVSKVDYLENWFHAFIQNKYGRKGRLLRTHVSFSGL